MSQALYERYKDALRRGHVAALREQLEAAEAAYRAAATIAPDRALPHTGLGGVLRRQGRLDEALSAYTAALARAPRDEAALRGRAELHADAGRRADAAHDFEALAAVLEDAGRVTEACDAARRALELAESRSRRHEAERLGALLRERREERPAVDAFDRALQILEAVEVPGPDPGMAPGSAPTSALVGPANSTTATSEPAVAIGATGAIDVPDDAPPDLVTDREWGSEPAPPPRPPDSAVLRAVADALLDSGDLASARERFLALATLHRAAGRHDAAMDACLALLAATPSDYRLQLEIASIQLDLGWAGAASEKLRLLARLADLDGDAEARQAIAALALDGGLEPARPAAPSA